MWHADRYVSGGGPAEAEKARILLKLMQFIGAVSGGKTVTQVALNYLMCKGGFLSVTMPATKNGDLNFGLVGSHCSADSKPVLAPMTALECH